MASSPRREFRAPAAGVAAPAPKMEDSRINDLRRQMDGINSKLDRLIESVAALAKPRATVPTAVKEEKPAEMVKETKKPTVKKTVKKEASKKKKK